MHFLVNAFSVVSGVSWVRKVFKAEEKIARDIIETRTDGELKPSNGQTHRCNRRERLVQNDLL